MQKTNTTDYEFAARLISSVPLYEFRRNELVCITPFANDEQDIKEHRSGIWHQFISTHLNDNGRISAHTYRSAWRKNYKELTKCFNPKKDR
jgi:hypothetical protein